MKKQKRPKLTPSQDFILNSEDGRDELVNSFASTAKSLPTEDKCVCIITALWGRTGSSVIFDAQTKFFKDRGYFVVRVFIEHWEKPALRDHLIFESTSSVPPHLATIAVRTRTIEQIEGKSSVGRAIKALSNSKPINPSLFRWIARNCDLVVVNHTVHVGFALRHFTCPIILETHDIVTELFDSHGVPDFAIGPSDLKEDREIDELKAIAAVDHCICFSDTEKKFFERAQANISVVKPYIVNDVADETSWENFLENTKLPKKIAEHGFDLIIWGDLHNGNVSSATEFFNNCLPLIAKQNFSIAIAGRLSEVLPEGLTKGRKVFRLGRVDNLHAVLRRSKVALLSDKLGTGLSIKAMDVFSLGMPFVATDRSLRGLNLTGIEYDPSTSNAELTNDLMKMLNSSAERRVRGKVAQSIYNGNFSRDLYEQVWGDVVRRVRTSSKQDTSQSVKISIVICTYDRYDLIDDAVRSCLDQSVSKEDYEIIIVDNFINPVKFSNLVNRMRDYNNVRVIAEPKRGLSNARNRGLSEARGKFIAYIDDDASACRTWCAEILRGFAFSENDIKVVGGSVKPIWSVERPTWLTDSYLGYLSVVSWIGPMREPNEDEWFVGCNIAFEREALLKVGGFGTHLGRQGDGSSLLSNEETEVISRILQLGGRRVYNPDASVDHHIDGGRLSEQWFRKRAAWQAVSDWLSNTEMSVNLFNSLESDLAKPLHNSSVQGIFRHFLGQKSRTLDSYEQTLLLLGGRKD